MSNLLNYIKKLQRAKIGFPEDGADVIIGTGIGGFKIPNVGGIWVGSVSGLIKFLGSDGQELLWIQGIHGNAIVSSAELTVDKNYQGQRLVIELSESDGESDDDEIDVTGSNSDDESEDGESDEEFEDTLNDLSTNLNEVQQTSKSFDDSITKLGKIMTSKIQQPKQDK